MCKLIDLVPLFVSSPVPVPDPDPDPDSVVSMASSLSSRLCDQISGTTNARGSRSMGGGYTQDINGRWHDSTGKFCKPPK